ncbi:galactokinase [Solihabitans fulvus]|uniref:Galactokinase n=1 Tax=Solihabitans fulvus TaxID=1892852 RepID=A0A5B2WVJ9_9PSEU|nr:galactokinase family protein [Solihabitans fulvus]KAA2254890.1 galactokinase [Solihabitans fulvus]
MTPANRAATAFEQLHGRAPSGVWSAPGRVNLIGEHTDYNDGFVLPFALPHRTAVAAAPRADGVLTVSTLDQDGQARQAEPVRIAELAPGQVAGWAAYPAGVAWALREQGVTGGADLVIAGDVPAGAGLSSSHALECAVALALLGLAGRQPDGVDGRNAHGANPDGDDTGTARTPDGSSNGSGSTTRQDIARWVQRSENDFVGAPTGLLDQTASLCCVEAHVLFLDVRSGEIDQVLFDATKQQLEVLVIDTRASHSHSDGGYGARRRGCEQAADLLGVPALRDIELAGLDAALAQLPEELRPLVRHVVTENDRVLQVVQLLRDGRLTEIGPLLTASHRSLRDDYRVSSVELDVAVEAALANGALGARMTGGGFGGSAIALVSSADRDAVQEATIAAFEQHGFGTPRMFTAVPSAGAGRDR